MYIDKNLSNIGFKVALYLEHLEEASALYEQRLSLLDDPEITWLDIDDFEERFEAHIDALVIGEDLALDVCKQQAVEGDFGELHAAIRVFCRQNRCDLFQEIIEALDFDDEEKVRAVIDALNHELPESWQGQFIKILSEKDRNIIPIVAEIIGYHRLPASDELLKVVQKSLADLSPKIIWALGRLREKAVVPLLLNYIHHEDEAFCSQSVLALLRIGEEQALSICKQYIKKHEWPLIPLGLGGNSSVIPNLIEIASLENMSDNCLITLGILGDISTVDTLLFHIENPDLAKSSAMALNLITGAELYEEVFIPEEIDKDELFDEELEKIEKGEPLYPAGEEPGTTITRLSENPEQWRKWWADNNSRFNSTTRYRNGKPYSAGCLLENLMHEKSLRTIRQLAYEELVIRYGIDFSFETDMLVSKQKQILAHYQKWIEANGSRFQEGKWYFAGELMV